MVGRFARKRRSYTQANNPREEWDLLFPYYVVPASWTQHCPGNPSLYAFRREIIRDLALGYCKPPSFCRKK